MLVNSAMSYARFEPNPLQLPALPTIEELIGLADADPRDSDWTKDTRIQTTGSVRSIPTAQAIVKASVKVQTRPSIVPIPRPDLPRTLTPTVMTRKTHSRSIAWPIFLCGFIAGISGGTAIAKSPVAKGPTMQHVVHAVTSIVR
jgi:hypothetical protein